MKTYNNFIDGLNILNGTITYNDFDINEDTLFENQRYSFKLDMLQISFGDRFILDVGWQPDFDQNGHFVVRAIQDYDWLNPLVKIKPRSLKTLKKAIEKAAKIIDEQMHIRDLPFRNIEY